MQTRCYPWQPAFLILLFTEVWEKLTLMAFLWGVPGGIGTQVKCLQGTVKLRESVRNEGHGKVLHSRVLKRQCLRKGKEEERPSKSTVTIILIQRSNQEACLSLEGSKLILSYWNVARQRQDQNDFTDFSTAELMRHNLLFSHRDTERRWLQPTTHQPCWKSLAALFQLQSTQEANTYK